MQKYAIDSEIAGFEHFKNSIDGHCKTFREISNRCKKTFIEGIFVIFFIFGREVVLEFMLTSILAEKHFCSNYDHFCKQNSPFNIFGPLKDSALNFSAFVDTSKACCAKF